MLSLNDISFDNQILDQDIPYNAPEEIPEHTSLQSLEMNSLLPFVTESQSEASPTIPKKKVHKHRYSKRLPAQITDILTDWYVYFLEFLI